MSGREASKCCCLAGGPIPLESGGSTGRQGVNRKMGSPPEGLVPKYSRLKGKGLRKTSAVKKECPTKNKWCACSTGLLAPVSSACHSPQPSAWDATSSSPSQSLYHCHVLPFVTKAAIITGTLFQALGDVCSPLATHLLILLWDCWSFSGFAESASCSSCHSCQDHTHEFLQLL